MESNTSLNRVLTSLSHKEPDKVPLMLLFSHYGAKELGTSIEDYFSNPDNIVEAQLKLHKKFRTDCLYGFYYASVEMEAFGGGTVFFPDGPPNSKHPVIDNINEIEKLSAPKVAEKTCLGKVLDSITKMKNEVNDKVPIIGVVMSPFSIPVMQLGFEKYLDLMYFHQELFEKLMQINEQFCVEWANAQLDAGATAICYFDPVSSTTNIPPDLYRKTGFEIAKRTLKQINGPTATHFASGRCLPIMDDVIETGTAIAGVSSLEDIGKLKCASSGKISLLGNLNGVEMCRWTKEEATHVVSDLIKNAGKSGGLLISDNHGEIPYLVKEETLFAISDAVEKFGYYPIH
jgi:uroporphyrinogen decarboxylase